MQLTQGPSSPTANAANHPKTANQTTTVNTVVNTVATSNLSTRLEIIKELLETAVQSTYGTHAPDEKRVAQLLGDSVKSRLFTAEESYLLKDRLLDSSSLERAIDRRIEIALGQNAA